MRNAFVDELSRLAESDPNVIAILADNGLLVFDEYQRRFPKQFLNVGIAEANMVAVAAGMASAGYAPFVYTILPFLTMRAFEFMKNDVVYQNQPVKMVGIGAGFAYSTLGPTHHGVEDIALVRTLPGLTVFSPADPLETALATRAAYQIDGPVYLRIGKGKDPKVYSENYDFVPGKAVVLREGKDITLVSTGSPVGEVCKAADLLSQQGVKATVLNMHTLQPFDAQAIKQAAALTGAVLTVEEHSLCGGLGSAVAEILAHARLGVRFDRIGFDQTFCHGYGSVQELRIKYGLHAAGIVTRAIHLLGSS